MARGSALHYWPRLDSAITPDLRTTDGPEAMKARALSFASIKLVFKSQRGDLLHNRDTKDCMYKKNALLFKIASVCHSNKCENFRHHTHTKKELLQRTKVMDAKLDRK